MLYLDDDRLTLEDIRNYPKDGADFFRHELRDELYEIEHNPPTGDVFEFVYGKHLVHRTPGLTKGRVKTIIKEKKRGINFPLSYTVQTGLGSQKCTYCETAVKNPGGGHTFKPRKKDFTGRLALHHKRDAEFILFIMKILPDFKNGNIILNNPRKDADMTAKDRARRSSVEFYLYNDRSPLLKEEGKLQTIALAWGVHFDESFTINQIVNALSDEIMAAEKAKNKAKNIDAFQDAIEEELPFMDELVIVQKAVNAKLIRYSTNESQWQLTIGERPKDLLIVPAGKKDQKNQMMAKYLNEHDNTFALLKTALGVDDEKDKGKPKAPDVGAGDDSGSNDGDLMAQYTKDTDFNALSWQDLRKIGHYLKAEPLNKEAILKKIAEYYQ